MKVVIYGRVSTHSQDVERQIEELVGYCISNGYEPLKTFTETISGVKTKKDRLGLSDLFDFVKTNKEVKGVLVWELSRLGRNTLDVLNTINELTELKVWVYSKKENLWSLNQDGTRNPNGDLLLNILNGVSSFERETIKSRSLSGLRKSISDGKWFGGKYLPYGYTKEDKRLVVDVVESEVVKLIFNLYLQGGLGTKRISQELNRRQIPTRYNKVGDSVFFGEFEKNGNEFKWRDQTIYTILTNPLYVGKKKGKNKLEGIDIYSPPIIDVEVFDEVQYRLKDSSGGRVPRFFYLLDKLVKCGVCGKNYFPHKRSNNKDNRYICISRRYDESCGNYGIGINKVQDGVWSVLRHNKEEKRNILNLNNNIDEINDSINKLYEKHKIFLEDVSRLVKEEQKILELYLEEKIDKVIYEKKYSQIRKDKDGLNRSINLCNQEIFVKERFKEKNSNVDNVLRSIKDNKNILKKTIENVVFKVVVYPIVKHNLDKHIKVNKQDVFVFIDVYTFMNEVKPISFIVSQRENNIITPEDGDYNRETKVLEVGRSLSVGGEEEEYDVNTRPLYHLTSLS